MANVRDIRRRIRSVKNTQQITRAMKFVAAARLRRAQDRVFSARPYANRMMDVLSSLAARASAEAHPLLALREERRARLLVITADRGLCGAFNSNIINAAVNFIERNRGADPSLTLVGKKGWDFFKKRRFPIAERYINIAGAPDFKLAREVAGPIINGYTAAEFDAVYLIYNEFKSVLQQQVVVEKLLPIARIEAKETLIDYIYEQPPQAIFDRLLPRYVEVQLFRALLESSAAEHAARMTAMDAATRNAEEMIADLTLTMNKVRQASITKELIEIVSGANALAAGER